METEPTGSGISRRRVLQGAAWAAPVVVLATAAPAAAASGGGDKYGQTSALGSFVAVNNVTLSDLSQAGYAEYKVGLQYQVWNDPAAFAGSGVQAYEAAAEPSFATWTVSVVIEILNSAGAAVLSTSSSQILITGKAISLENPKVHVGPAGKYTLRVTVSSNQVATAKGHSFALRTVTQSTTLAIT